MQTGLYFSDDRLWRIDELTNLNSKLYRFLRTYHIYIYIKNKPQQKDIHHGFIDILIVSDTTQFSVTFVSSWWNEFIPNHSIINDKNKTIGIVVGIYRCSVWMRQNTLKMKQVLLFRASFNRIPTGSYNQYPITAPIHSTNWYICVLCADVSFFQVIQLR